MVSYHKKFKGTYPQKQNPIKPRTPSHIQPDGYPKKFPKQHHP